jgi:hypothetical protein
MDPTDDNDAEYLILVGEGEYQLLVSIPHFSTHTIVVTVRGRHLQSPEFKAEGTAKTLLLLQPALGALMIAILVRRKRRA